MIQMLVSLSIGITVSSEYAGKPVIKMRKREGSVYSRASNWPVSERPRLFISVCTSLSMHPRLALSSLRLQFDPGSLFSLYSNWNGAKMQTTAWFAKRSRNNGLKFLKIQYPMWLGLTCYIHGTLIYFTHCTQTPHLQHTIYKQTISTLKKPFPCAVSLFG